MRCWQTCPKKEYRTKCKKKENHSVVEVDSLLYSANQKLFVILIS